MMSFRRARRWIAAACAAVLATAVVAGCGSLDEWQRQTIFNPARDNPRWFTDPLPGTYALVDDKGAFLASVGASSILR
jgi:hypothetical protein